MYAPQRSQQGNDRGGNVCSGSARPDDDSYGGTRTPDAEEHDAVKYLHTMVRVSDLDASLEFYCRHLGLRETRRHENEQGRYTLVFVAAPDDAGGGGPELELTYNWDPEDYGEGRNFGHVAYRVENIYDTCERLMSAGVTINRPPRDGRMAFVRSPDDISIELLQAGEALPPAEPWASMENTGHW